MKKGRRKIENKKREILFLYIFRSPFSVFRFSASRRLGVLFVFLFLLAACNELQKPKTEPFYAENPTPPPAQEFRWSNGKMPKSFDPALVAASPEADFVRALYEGLTDIDSKTLQPVPAVAVRWAASGDFKTWTFYLRKDAKWSNGDDVVADDFVDSWKRLVEMGDKVPQRGLLKNIVGMDTENVLPVFASEEVDLLSKDSTLGNSSQNNKKQSFANGNSNTTAEPKTAAPKTEQNNSPQKKNEKPSGKKARFGVEALDDYTLKVSLVEPDKNFPALVAHPIFRPIYDEGDFEGGKLSADIVTNGAFRIASIEPNGIVLERADYYWNAKEIKLERVRFVPTDSAENALAAYRAGEVDVVTNADFKPLALKLLAPYDDFRRTTHSALVYYVFNRKNKPFDDARVRKALATAIERERLTEDEMDGASHPALGFSPFSNDQKLSQDAAEAQQLLKDAGFPNGANFPAVRLLVNRNDVQRRIARSVAKMWKKNLNIETEIIVKDQADFEATFQNGEYDLARRGVVLPTTDETANILALFPPPPPPDTKIETVKEERLSQTTPSNIESGNHILSEKNAESDLNLTTAANEAAVENKTETYVSKNESPEQPQQTLLTEEQALEQLPAIPLYFPTSYSLVKPYVEGFEINALDAPSLKSVRINNNWQPNDKKFISNDQN